MTTPDLWPADARPTATVEAANTDEWLTARSGPRARARRALAPRGSGTDPAGQAIRL
nr:hypothetical protein OG296_00150 [Streptomyces sp. NBC_01001]